MLDKAENKQKQRIQTTNKKVKKKSIKTYFFYFTFFFSAKFEFSFFGDLSEIRYGAYLSQSEANFLGSVSLVRRRTFVFSVSLWPPIEFAFIAFIVLAAACGRPAYWKKPNVA